MAAEGDGSSITISVDGGQCRVDAPLARFIAQLRGSEGPVLAASSEGETPVHQSVPEGARLTSFRLSEGLIVDAVPGADFVALAGEAGWLVSAFAGEVVVKPTGDDGERFALAPRETLIVPSGEGEVRVVPTGSLDGDEQARVESFIDEATMLIMGGEATEAVPVVAADDAPAEETPAKVEGAEKVAGPVKDAPPTAATAAGAAAAGAAAAGAAAAKKAQQGKRGKKGKKRAGPVQRTSTSATTPAKTAGAAAAGAGAAAAGEGDAATSPPTKAAPVKSGSPTKASPVAKTSKVAAKTSATKSTGAGKAPGAGKGGSTRPSRAKEGGGELESDPKARRAFIVAGVIVAIIVVVLLLTANNNGKKKSVATTGTTVTTEGASTTTTAAVAPSTTGAPAVVTTAAPTTTAKATTTTAPATTTTAATPVTKYAVAPKSCVQQGNTITYGAAITNQSTATFDYVIHVSFVDKAGNEVAKADASVSRLAAGKSADFSATGTSTTKLADSGAQCTVPKIDATPSK